MELNELKRLLNHPDQLKSVIENLRRAENQTEEVKGFITLYDAFEGDAFQINNYLIETEYSIINKIRADKKLISIVKYAALFVAVLGITMFLYFNKYSGNKTIQRKAVSENLYKDPGIPIYMSEETKINWGELMFAIDNETSEKAVQVWKKIQKSNPKNDTVLYYGGIVYLNDLQVPNAIKFFKANLKKESYFNDQSLYFIAINEWEKGNKTKAKQLLLKLQNCKNQDLKYFVNLNLKELLSKK